MQLPYAWLGMGDNQVRCGDISILAAIALPAYQNYTQSSANTACLGEAKAWASARVADVAIGTPKTGQGATGIVFGEYTKSACAEGPMKTKATEASKGTSISGADNQRDAFIGTKTLYFSPQTRGTKAEWKAVECKTESGTCKLV